MRKFTNILSFALVLCMVFVMVACGPTPTPTPTPSTDKPDTPNPLAGTYDITMWVSELAGVDTLTQAQIDAFEAANPGIVINATITGVTEADAASKVLADVATAPDIFCFAQDQLARLVQAGALAAPSDAIANAVKAANDKGSVGAGSVGGKLYAYPLTSDNGYFMYYDKSIVTNPESLEDIIRDVEAYNAANGTTKWIRFGLENGWYTASFFFAAAEGEEPLCVNEWTTDAEGNFTSVVDTFNSPNGLIAMKGMRKLAQSSAYNSDENSDTDVAVWINGMWNAEKAEAALGENFAVTDLPSFTVDGKSYHLGSFTGNKLMGVKPQADGNRALVLALLAQYLTGETCQMERFNEFQWGPSNLNAQKSEGVQNNPSLAALALQGAYGKAQGQISGSWWDLAKVLGAEAKAAKSDADLQTALETYKTAVDATLNKTDKEKEAWSVIGNLCGTNWNTDFPMTKQEDGKTYISDPLDLKKGEEFKVRQGASWDVNFGQTFNGANLVVEADGKYTVVFVWESKQEGTVTLVPVQ